jgi:hypothetical protein
MLGTFLSAGNALDARSLHSDKMRSKKRRMIQSQQQPFSSNISRLQQGRSKPLSVNGQVR